MSIETRQRQRQTVTGRRSRTYVWSSPSEVRVRRLHGAVVFLIAAALIGAVGMLYLLQTNHVARLGYEMSRLQEDREVAMVEQQELSAQIAAKQALTTVELIARRDLGMKPIDDHVFLDVELPAAEPAPEPEPDISELSVLERFWGRITGRSTTEGGRDD